MCVSTHMCMPVCVFMCVIAIHGTERVNEVVLIKDGKFSAPQICLKIIQFSKGSRVHLVVTVPDF